MKKLLALSTALLLVACGDTPTQTEFEVEPDMARLEGAARAVAAGRIHGCDEADCYTLTVGATGTELDGHGTFAWTDAEGQHRYQVTGVRKSISPDGAHRWAWVYYDDGVPTTTRSWFFMSTNVGANNETYFAVTRCWIDWTWQESCQVYWVSWMGHLTIR